MFLTSKYKIILSGLMIILSFLIAGQIVLAAKETGAQKASKGLDTTAEQGFGKDITSDTDLSSIIGKIVGAALAFLGVAFFVLMIYGGYTWMFAMGNEQTASKAKDIIIAAVIGLIIVLLAYVVTAYLGSVVAPAS